MAVRGGPVLHTLMIILYLLHQAQTQDYFVQIGDIHWDPTYASNYSSTVSCNEERPREELGQYGDYECDSPWYLLHTALQHMRELGTPEFVAWLGDTIYSTPDGNNLPSQSETITMISNVTSIIQSIYGDRQVLPVMGNHDYYPVNQLPGGIPGDVMYEALADLWSDWIGDDQLENFKNGGYYSSLIQRAESLRAVILNSNLYITANNATRGQDDPGGQYKWFESIMESAIANEEKVYIFLHVPPGALAHTQHTWSFRPEHNVRLSNLFRQYASQILGIFSAHEHSDTFRLFYSENSPTPVAAMFIAPSLTPKRGLDYDDAMPRNPAVRRVKYNRNTYEPSDIIQYYVQLDDDEKDQIWKQEYHFLQAYGLTKMSLPYLQVLLNDMNEFGSPSFHTYYRHSHVDLQRPHYQAAGCAMKQQHLCAIEFVDVDPYTECIEKMAACDANRNVLSLSMAVMLLLFLLG